MLWKTRKFFKDLFARYQTRREMWGLKACRLFFSISSACTSLKRKKSRDGILRAKILVVKVLLWTTKVCREGHM